MQAEIIVRILGSFLWLILCIVTLSAFFITPLLEDLSLVYDTISTVEQVDIGPTGIIPIQSQVPIVNQVERLVWTVVQFFIICFVLVWIIRLLELFILKQTVTKQFFVFRLIQFVVFFVLLYVSLQVLFFIDSLYIVSEIFGYVFVGLLWFSYWYFSIVGMRKVSVIHFKKLYSFKEYGLLLGGFVFCFLIELFASELVVFFLLSFYLVIAGAFSSVRFIDFI